MVYDNGMMDKPSAVVGDGEGQIPPTHSWAALRNPLMFAQLGLDRDVPMWRECDFTKPVLHLGPGVKHIEGTIEYDWPHWDFDKMGHPLRFPYATDSVGGVIATHVLEHLKDPRNLLREVSRILAPGRPFNILVPHGQSLMFLQDLDHKTAFVTETWKTLLENPYYIKEHDGFSFHIGANFIFGLKESNTALITQLIKE
jgi:SAM-dependent methyltransferase